MPTLKKAKEGDFESVYPLLKSLDPSIDKATWARFFKPHWPTEEDYVGYLLEEGGKVVGFLGLLFSTRVINGNREKFCNMTTWDVKEEYRKHSLSLLYPVLGLKDYTITNFSATPKVNVMLKKLGFNSLDEKALIIFPNPFDLLRKKNRYEVFFNNAIPSNYLNENDLNIFRDHSGYKCTHVLIKLGNVSCYFIMKKIYKKGIPVASIQYINNAEFFAESINYVKYRLMLERKKMLLQVDSRMLKDYRIKNSVKISLKVQKLYRSQRISAGDVDNLYSELLLW
jgi:hypothetical protein